MPKDHNAVTLVRLEPADPQSRVKQSTTEPLHSRFSLFIGVYMFVYVFVMKFLINKYETHPDLHCLQISLTIFKDRKTVYGPAHEILVP